MNRRWRIFFKQSRSKLGLAGILTMLFFSMTAELWSHHLPLMMLRSPVAGQARKIYFPALKTYSVAEFGVTDAFTVDYRELLAKDHAEGLKTWALFPVNHWDPYIQSNEVLASPSREHWLGTDNLGRDVTARLLYGARVSLAYGLLYWLFSFAIGITLGAIQGYFAGTFDFLTERIKELAEIVPFLSIVILVNGLAKSQSFWITLWVVIAFAWISISSQIRAQFLSLRKRDFCEAARSVGASHTRIIFSHILPNALTPILTLSPFAISAGIATLAVLDYLGFGLNPPTPSLGELLSQGRVYITNAPWLLFAPTAVLAIILISINLIGESLREAFDPRRA